MRRSLPRLSPKPDDNPGGSWVLRPVLIKSCSSPCDGMFPREKGKIPPGCIALCVRVERSRLGICAHWWSAQVRCAVALLIVLFYYSSIKETRAVAQQLRYFVAERAVQKATLDRVAEESKIWSGQPRIDWVSLLPFFLISRPLYVHMEPLVLTCTSSSKRGRLPWILF